MNRAWCLIVLLCLAALWSSAAGVLAAEPDASLKLVIAATKATEKPPTTVISLLDPRDGTLSELYRDPQEGRRILAKIASSDVVGSARATEPVDICAVVGPTTAGSNSAMDAISRLRLPESSWEQITQIPLCYSEASSYGMWNRAPLFAISPDQRRVAITALRVGETALAVPSIRVLAMYGAEEWQIPLPGKMFEVADLAWSPDGAQLAYAVRPLGDEDTLDESLLPQAGVYLADVHARTSLLLHHCFPAALAWSPKANRITVAVGSDVLGPAGVVRTITFPGGQRVEEFSVPGSAQAIAYSADGGWLAIQVFERSTQVVQVRETSGGWARSVYRLPASEGRLALLGWVRIPED